MTPAEFRDLVRTMRWSQKHYFEALSEKDPIASDFLTASKELEKLVDEALRKPDNSTNTTIQTTLL